MVLWLGVTHGAAWQYASPPRWRGGGDSPSKQRPALSTRTRRCHGQLEAVLLAADEPLPIKRLAQVAGLPDTGTTRRLLRKLQGFYDRDGTAFQIEELAGGFQLLSRPEYHRWLANLRRGQNELRLTGAARETLAIVAYRQPIVRADIEGIRGVHCGETLRLLMEKGLVRIAGRDDSLGRPVLYGTTKRFLQIFGLRSLKDLPRAEELKNMGE